MFSLPKSMFILTHFVKNNIEIDVHYIEIDVLFAEIDVHFDPFRQK